MCCDRLQCWGWCIQVWNLAYLWWQPVEKGRHVISKCTWISYSHKGLNQLHSFTISLSDLKNGRETQLAFSLNNESAFSDNKSKNYILGYCYGHKIEWPDVHKVLFFCIQILVYWAPTTRLPYCLIVVGYVVVHALCVLHSKTA